MSDRIIVPKRTDEEIEAFFKKNQWRIANLLDTVDPYLDTTPLEDASIVEVPLESYIEDNEDDTVVSSTNNEEE